MRGLCAALALGAGMAVWPGESLGDTRINPIDLGEGENEAPWDRLTERKDEQTGKKRFHFVAHNKTGKLIQDFELELKNCGDKAKFYRIKVYPRAVLDGKGGFKEVQSDRDWDVDDNLNGRTDQAMADDPGSKRTSGDSSTRQSDETDNVDDSPDTRARVDADGNALANCCGGGVETGSATQAGAEDGGETMPGAGKDSADGVQPGDSVILEIELTALPEGGECKLAVVPSFTLRMSKPAVSRPEDDRPLEPAQPYEPEPETPAPQPEGEPGTPAPEPRAAEEGEIGTGTSGCPEGKFAGGLGGLLGLPPACEDPSRRRDTDRTHGDKEEHKE
jgi:hypothetical protein